MYCDIFVGLILVKGAVLKCYWAAFPRRFDPDVARVCAYYMGPKVPNADTMPVLRLGETFATLCDVFVWEIGFHSRTSVTVCHCWSRQKIQKTKCIQVKSFVTPGKQVIEIATLVRRPFFPRSNGHVKVLFRFLVIPNVAVFYVIGHYHTMLNMNVFFRVGCHTKCLIATYMLRKGAKDKKSFLFMELIVPASYASFFSIIPMTLWHIYHMYTHVHTHTHTHSFIVHTYNRPHITKLHNRSILLYPYYY